MNTDFTVAVLGLGYVGLPLAVEFGKKINTIGFDLSEKIIENCREHYFPGGEVDIANYSAAKFLRVTNNSIDLKDADFFIVAVPTPVDEACTPNFSALKSASSIIGSVMKKGAIVVFESTVYPGATEDICIPILEKASGYTWKKDFFVGYSPERVNPGDKIRTLTRIVKIVSADTSFTLSKVEKLYSEIISAGLHSVSSIKVAEAAKVIENSQRDLNIAFVNELAIIFNRLGIDTQEVLEAAGTKWNFLPFVPGLVGGHCIGVDPYYLTHKSEMIGYHPQVILAGRRINDGMAEYIVNQTIKQLIRSGIKVKNSKVIIMGLTFKENCPDIRNSKVVDIINQLNEYSCQTYVTDPIAIISDVHKEYEINLLDWESLPTADAIIFAVKHEKFKCITKEMILNKLNPNGVIVDIKSLFNKNYFQDCKVNYWRL